MTDDSPTANATANRPPTANDATVQVMHSDNAALSPGEGGENDSSNHKKKDDTDSMKHMKRKDKRKTTVAQLRRKATEQLNALVHKTNILKTNYVRAIRTRDATADEINALQEDSELLSLQTAMRECESEAYKLTGATEHSGQPHSLTKHARMARTKNLVNQNKLAHAKSKQVTIDRTKGLALTDLRQAVDDLRVLQTTVEALTIQEKDTEMQALLNPECTDVKTTDDKEAPLDTFQSNTIYVNLDGLEDDTHSTDTEIEEFFLKRPLGSTTYHSTYTTLQLRIDEQLRSLNAIVDTGAAYCAISQSKLRELFPNAPIQTEARRFKDASGNLMPLVGSVRLRFKIGDLWLWTTVFVFERLGAAFLLGVNAMEPNELAVSYKRSVIFSEANDATSRSFEKVHSKTTKDNTHTAFAFSDAGCECGCETRGDTLLCYEPHQRCLSLECADGRTTSIFCHRGKRILHTDLEPTAITMRTTCKHKIPAGSVAQPITLKYSQYLKGPDTTVELELDPEFKSELRSKGVVFNDYHLHSSRNQHACILVSNPTDQDIVIRGDRLVAHVAPTQTNSHATDPEAWRQKLALKVIAERPASLSKWQCVGDTPPTSMIHCSDGEHKQLHCRILHNEQLAKLLPKRTTLSEDEVTELGLGTTVLMSHCLLADDGKYYSPYSELEFDKGGRPRDKHDLAKMEFNLDDAIDPSKPKDANGKYPPLSDELKEELYDIALRWWFVWSRDSRVPDISHLVVLDIPTGDATPVAQKPYPLPYQYLEAVRDEVQKLLDGGLIEPCISNWASPVLVRLKKDSTPDKIRLKLIIDYRKLNEVTVPDEAGLGDQQEILDGFGGDQRYAGIVDAAGGFYQLLLKPSCRHKSAFILPTSMGGTQFQWRVAPYGLTRNPSGYSRGMMFALKGLDHCSLDHGRATGGSKSWIDDVSMHSNTFAGFTDLFNRILSRFAHAGMTLKASKCFLLHQKLEVLGYYITPDGLIMQPSKIQDLEKFNKGKYACPSNVKEIRAFLGAVQFYRRFVPRISLLVLVESSRAMRNEGESSCLGIHP